uniref:Uncharacterized protein n=1 Tax=Anguilla anguilla TaxID=7936 RepID=A0A0E9TL43_ANGAN
MKYAQCLNSCCQYGRHFTFSPSWQLSRERPVLTTCSHQGYGDMVKL